MYISWTYSALHVCVTFFIWREVYPTLQSAILNQEEITYDYIQRGIT